MALRQCSTRATDLSLTKSYRARGLKIFSDSSMLHTLRPTRKRPMNGHDIYNIYTR